jgi:predicted aspartyl protease
LGQPLFLFVGYHQAAHSYNFGILKLSKLLPMKSVVLLILLFLIVRPSVARQSDGPSELVLQLQALVEQKDYFALKDAWELRGKELPRAYAMYFEAILGTVFNHPRKSNGQIDRLLKLNPQPLSPDWLKRVYSIKLQNHIDLFEYEQAAKTSRFIVETYADRLDTAEVDEYRNSLKIWEALQAVPRQEIIRDGDFNGTLTRDKMGLLRINTCFGSDSLSFVFDTGANFSVMQRSVARRLGLQLLPAGFKVTAATGQKVNSSLAVAPEISFGGIHLKNVVFLVLDDPDLSFPQVGYNIEGIVGFPVIKAMDEIRIDRNNQLYVPRIPGEYPRPNVAFDGLMPVVAVNYRGDRLCFHFDTGATHTSLFPPFYRKYRQEIDRKYKRRNFNAGSAGGETTLEGYIIRQLPLSVAGAEARLKKISLNMNETGVGDDFYGNLGQDFIQQFRGFTISFKDAAIRFYE